MCILAKKAINTMCHVLVQWCMHKKSVLGDSGLGGACSDIRLKVLLCTCIAFQYTTHVPEVN